MADTEVDDGTGPENGAFRGSNVEDAAAVESSRLVDAVGEPRM